MFGRLNRGVNSASDKGHRMPAKSKSTPSFAVVSGNALWKALGFAHERAFQRARQANQLGIRLYPLPGKSRGVYARVDDLAEYLSRQTASSSNRSSSP